MLINLNFEVVGAKGIEPLCDRLPFLLLIRQRGYAPYCVAFKVRYILGERIG